MGAVHGPLPHLAATVYPLHLINGTLQPDKTLLPLKMFGGSFPGQQYPANPATAPLPLPRHPAMHTPLTAPAPAPLPQERAYVTGLSAANLVVSRLGVGRPATILDVEEDEPHIAAARTAVRTAREAADALGLKSPFL